MRGRQRFRVAPQVVSPKFNEIEPNQIVKRPTIDRVFQDAEFSSYIMRLFAFTGLLNWPGVQGAWTLVLFPSTGRGRYFTINIGPHEVAFSTLPQRDSGNPIHEIVMDCLIYDFPDAADWVVAHKGGAKDDAYVIALPRSVEFYFEASFDEALEFLRLEGVRRALIAYWAEALIGIKERGASSVFARFHNWNALAEIRARAIGAV
jgi:hypothetical protein